MAHHTGSSSIMAYRVQNIALVNFSAQDARKTFSRRWPLVGIFGLAGLGAGMLGVTAVLIAHNHPGDGSCHRYNDLMAAILIGSPLLFVVGAIIGIQIYLWRMPKMERERHEQSIALEKKITLFNERLEALQELAKLTEYTDSDFQETVFEDYESERKQLEREKRARLRKEAIRKFDAAIAKETDGKFKDTRDVASHLLIARIRLADETVAVATVEEDERFTALEEPEQPAKRFTSSTHS